MSRRVLVIDDDPDVLGYVSRSLESEGFEVRGAATGRAGLDAAVAAPPDVVLLDLSLPDTDGYGVLQALQSGAATSHVPVVLLTVASSVEELVRGLDAGADDYVTKPFAIEELIARVGSVLRRSKSLRELSPLTGLPGNFRIAEVLQSRIVAGGPLAVIHADLDNFKAFNDHYGFMRGDNVIKFTANTLIDAAMYVDDPTAFVGHVGGDDFIVVMGPERAEAFCKEVIQRFDDGILDFYDPQDAMRGSVEVIDRRGERHAFPIVSISLGVATNLRRSFASEWEASAVASEMKEHAKSETGSSYRVDRRAG
jgi:diguanylate cyclase (GGDEF)-like protein